MIHHHHYIHNQSEIIVRHDHDEYTCHDFHDSPCDDPHCPRGDTESARVLLDG